MLLCECSDRRCPEHEGVDICFNLARQCLTRIDMDDETGTLMCEECAQDALESGLFCDNIKAWIEATREGINRYRE